MIPTLAQCRGKIVLLRRFSAPAPLGLDASPWPDNRTFTVHNAATLRIQDHYRVATAEEKWSAVAALLAEAPSAAPDTLYLNFASGYIAGAFDIPSIPSVSTPTNERLQALLRQTSHARLGIVITDFSSPRIAQLIVATNF
jgi:1-phosphatidylinositol phosphodiesterase